jgi:DNA-binding protein H-NS
MPKQNYQALQSQIKKLQDKAESMRLKQRQPVLASIVKSMREYDVSLEELKIALDKGAPSARKASGRPAATKTTVKVARPVAPKYRHPDTGETWTGRGKAPRWLAAAESSGSSRDSFLIAE